MTETAVADPAAEFAQLMSGAQQAADIEAGADPEAPYGWTVDPKTGERRPKKSAGRPRKPPSADELRESGPPPPVPPDEAPGKPPRGSARPKDDKDPAGVPAMPRSGLIATGVNKLYRRAGRFLRAMDHDIGQAVIECTKPDPEDPDWMTVGEAWEQVAKTSPSIRAWLLRMIAGGAWTDLVMAHAPIGAAIIMKPAIMRILPFKKLIESMTSDEDGDGGDLGGLSAEDAQAMGQRMGLDLEAMAERVARKMSDEPEPAMAGNGVPPAFRRQQPRNASRAQRRHK